ncbi:MAG: TIR domain-containing protein, partial [Promethearchaeota archaeon]
MSQEFVCAACGLPQDKSVIMKKIQNHLLCPVCTSNGTTEPEFEASVYAVALGYFMNEQQGYDAIDALQYAYTFVSELPYWKGKDLPPLTQTGLKRMQTIQAMHTRRTRSEYGEESLDFFISHGGAEIDETFVGHLVTALKKQGYSVWYDETNWVTETGQKSETVDKRIEQARHCVTILDQPYFSSEHCKNELHTIFTTKELKHVFPVWSKEINPSFLKQQEHGEKILDIVSVGWNDWLGDGKKLSDALLQLAQQAEGLQRYNNVPLIRTDAQLLEQLESLIHQKISPLKQQELSSATFGFYAEKNRITTLILINKGLSRLPDDIGRCGDLKNLQLGENRLNSLPKSLGNLRDLQKLELQRNQLSSLPTSIGNLVNLKELNLYDNQLSSLPASIGNLTNLHVFNLWHNLLES